MTVQSVTRMLFSRIMDQQGPGKGCVLLQTNVPEDAYYIPNPPGPMIDIDWGIRDWIWDHEAQEWQKVPRAEDDPRGPEEPSE